jgi:hypothetical protein
VASAVEHQLHGLWVCLVLLDEDAGGEGFFGVALQHRHGALNDDRAGVELGGHEVHGDATHLHTVRERLPLRVQSGERGKQRGVDVHDCVGERRDEPGAYTSHEPRQADHVHVVRAELVHQRAIVVVARRPPAMVEDGGLDAGQAGAIEPAGPGHVRDHDGDRRLEAAVRHGVDERLEIAAAAGDQDAEPPGRHARHASDGTPV